MVAPPLVGISGADRSAVLFSNMLVTRHEGGGGQQPMDEERLPGAGFIHNEWESALYRQAQGKWGAQPARRSPAQQSSEPPETRRCHARGPPQRAENLTAAHTGTPIGYRSRSRTRAAPRPRCRRRVAPMRARRTRRRTRQQQEQVVGHSNNLAAAAVTSMASCIMACPRSCPRLRPVPSTTRSNTRAEQCVCVCVWSARRPGLAAQSPPPSESRGPSFRPMH